MRQLERLTVHVEEAIRLASAEDEPHVRLGLILLDSAAELIMHRACEWHLPHAQMYNNLIQSYEELAARTGNSYSEKLTEYRAKVVSKNQVRKIEREFDAKCDFLVREGLLSETHARVLKKLHDYRNETYHRDRVRPQTLTSAARIYVYLVCTMMHDIRPWGVGYGSDGPPPGLRKYLDVDRGEDGLGLLDVGLGLQAQIATRLLDEAGVAAPAQLGHALAQHALDRLDALQDSAQWCADTLSDFGHRGDWDVEAALCLVQVESAKLMTIHTADEARSAVGKYRENDLAIWRARGEAIATESDDPAAFALFADLEDEFEPIEALVQEFERGLDAEIQHQIDVMRGK